MVLAIRHHRADGRSASGSRGGWGSRRRGIAEQTLGARRWFPFIPREDRENLAVTVAAGPERVDSPSILTFEIELAGLNAAAPWIAGAGNGCDGLLPGGGHDSIVAPFVANGSSLKVNQVVSG